jgi:hypothetical protein
VVALVVVVVVVVGCPHPQGEDTTSHPHQHTTGTGGQGRSAGCCQCLGTWGDCTALRVCMHLSMPRVQASAVCCCECPYMQFVEWQLLQVAPAGVAFTVNTSFWPAAAACLTSLHSSHLRCTTLLRDGLFQSPVLLLLLCAAPAALSALQPPAALLPTTLRQAALLARPLQQAGALTQPRLWLQEAQPQPQQGQV